MCDFCLGELQAAGLPGSGYVFRRCDGRLGPNTPAKVSHLANEHLREWGATLHMCRHRFLTMVQRESHDLRLTQELAGHARPESTVGYVAFDQPEAVRAVQALPVPGCLRLARPAGA